MSVKIYQGEDKSLSCLIKTKVCEDSTDYKAYDLTGITAATAQFFGHTANFTVTMAGGQISVVSPAGAGELQIDLTDTNTAALKKGINSFEVSITESGGDVKIVQFLQAIEVVESLF